MSSETTDKKEYKAPQGATNDLTWTAADNSTKEIEVTAEWIVLRKNEKPAAEIFHTYYKVINAHPRPVTFVFNGGPGAASAYLHIGGLAPQRVMFEDDGNLPPPPARLVNNAESWIAFTDLVFVDPVGTGFSRIIENDTPAAAGADKDKAGKIDAKEFYALNRDLESLGEFIERFLSKHKLWDVPVNIAGESYGGFRTAKLARRLQEKHGIGLNTVIAISPALEWAFLNGSDYEVIHFMDSFCVMALAAAFHGRSKVFKKGEPIENIRRQIEAFATRELAHALMVGTGHEEKELNKTYARVAEFLGLPESLVSRGHGRVPFWRFSRELLRDQRRIVGYYDATITAIDPFPDREMPELPDPTLIGISRIFESGINHLLRSQIGVETDRRYEALNMDVNSSWKRDEMKHVFEAPAGSTDDLRFAMSMNPHMKVLITHGYYDMVTPYFSSERLVEQMKLLPEQRKNLAIKHFGGGHMFYTWSKSRADFRDWVAQFFS